MPWIFFSITSVIFVSIASLLQKILMRDDKSDAHAYSIIFQLLGAVFVGIFAVINGFIFPPIFQYPLNFFLVAVLYGLGTLFLFSALKYIEASEVTIITSTRSLVTIISAVLLLGEVFNLQSVVGALLIIISIVLISGKRGKLKFDRGFIYALAVAVCYGLAVTNDAYILRYVDLLSFTSVAFLLPALFLIIIRPSSIKKTVVFLKPELFLKMLTLTIIYCLAALSFYSALGRGGAASQVGPINQASVILTVILAAFFLNERDNLFKKLVSAVLVIVGILLIK